MAKAKAKGKKAGAGRAQTLREIVPEKFIITPLHKIGVEKYKNYGVAVLEDRAIPDFRDGMIPVNRHVLTAAQEKGFNSRHKLVKSAKIVGDVLGSYHPHGDCLRGDTLVPLLNGKTTTIKRLSESKSGKRWVLSFDKTTGKYKPALAYAWRRGQNTDKMYRIHLSTGDVFETTGNHQFLVDGTWVAANRLQPSMNLTGGDFVYSGGYTSIHSGKNEKLHLHTLVGNAILGKLEDGEVYHHKDHNSENNVPSNLEILSRAEHAYEHEENYKAGLSNGRDSMFAEGTRLRKAVKKKNSALMSEYNKQLAVIKAFKAVALLKERGTKVTAKAYQDLIAEKVIYNLTTLERLSERGWSLAQIVKQKEFKLDTSKATGLTRHLKEPKVKEHKPRSVISNNLWISIAKTFSSLFAQKQKISWDNYIAAARSTCSSANWAKVVYANKEKLQNNIGIVGVTDLLRAVPAAYLCVVTKVEQVRLDTPEDFYDFTVDKYENMIVCPATNKDVFVVVHNSSTYGAMVGMTNVKSVINNHILGLIEGGGNWGSMSDRSYAAHRYTEARLSKFSDEVLFNPFYWNEKIVPHAPNFDSSGKVPLVLPALLPILFLSGQFGIAPGARTNVPAFEFKSMLKTLRLIYEGEDITPKFLYKNLRFTSLYGGAERLDTLTQEQKEDRLAVFTTRKGKVKLWGNPVWDAKAKTIKATMFGNKDIDIEKLLGQLMAISGVKSAYDDSDKTHKYGLIVVECSKTLTTVEYGKLFTKVDEALAKQESYTLNFTQRYKDEEGQAQAKMRPMSITEAMTAWVAWRTALEVRACKYHVGQTDKQIRRLELMCLAVDNRKIIIESLDKDCSQQDLEIWLAKKLKIAVEDAQVIYNLQIKSLRRLERKTLEAKIKEFQAEKAKLEKRGAKPHVHMAKQLEDFVSIRPKSKELAL